jgi:hypothetical protein
LGAAGRHDGRVRAFTCPDCRHLVLFESLECLNSNTLLAFDWERREIVSLARSVACSNRESIGCNGIVAGTHGLCFSCALTRTRPQEVDDGLVRLAKAETSKRRLIFELLELGLPVDGYLQRDGGLAFDMLNSERAEVVTGHENGLITLDLAEANDAHRERIRAAMGEPYRTLLGHLRHEIAHYYEPILCPEGSLNRDRYREWFGDERADYQEAMDRHYATGPPNRWFDEFVSAYASMHPWEDWAETFAHYLHIRDSLQTSITYGITVAGPAVQYADQAPLHSYPATAPDGIIGLLDAWLPLTYALNAMNRSMGADDIYPFVLPPRVVGKLGFIHELVAAH